MEVLHRVRLLALCRARLLLSFRCGDTKPHPGGDRSVCLYLSFVLHPPFTFVSSHSIFDDEDGAQHVFNKAAAVAGLTDMHESSLDEKDEKSSQT